MKKKNLWKPTRWVLAFLILAFVFLALGLGTLGSLQSTGKGYVLPVITENDSQKPGIVVQVTDPEDVGHGTTGHTHVNNHLWIKHVYINVGTIYANPGEVATVRLGRGISNESTFSNYIELNIANYFYDAENAVKEIKPAPLVDANFNWVEFDLTAFGNGWELSTYSWFKLTAEKYDVLINEIIFVANTEKDEGEDVVLNARVDESSNLSYDRKSETIKDAVARASAIVDKQHVPSFAQSSFFRYGEGELASLITAAEMRSGSNYSASAVYDMDKISSALGSDLIALGTLIFGMSPFGLRVIPFLASFGVLVFGFLFVRRLAKSDKAGFVFAVLYAFCGMSFSLGHFGAPFTLGLCFLLASLYFCYRYYEDGMKKANALSAMPALLSGLCAAAAINVNGAFVLPVLGIVALFVAGALRWQKKGRKELDLVIDEAEKEEKTEAATASAEESEGPTPRQKVAKALGEYRFRNTVAPALFSVLLVIGTFLLAVLSLLPAYYTFVKVYDNPANPAKSIFYFVGKSLTGGFAGSNIETTPQSAWSLVYVLFRGTGERYAVTATGWLVAVAAIIAALCGLVYTVWKLVRVLRERKENFQRELAVIIVLLAGLVLSLVTAAFAQGALAFLLGAYVFGFALAAYALQDAEAQGGKLAKAANVVSVCWLCVLAVCFGLFAVFTFSIPTAGFMAALIG